jgi:hypothetical protein
MSGHWTTAILAAAFALSTIVIVTGEIIGGHVIAAIFFGLVVGGGGVQWWILRKTERSPVDSLAWTFAVLAVAVADQRWDVVQAWLSGG